MNGLDEIWFPLVDEPIGRIVQQIQAEDAEIERLAGTPHRILAFRTWAYIRVGILLGRLLVEQDIKPDGGTATWVERLLEDPARRALVVAEVRSVAEEIAADPRYAGDEQLGPDEDARERFREFARRLEAT
jgi:hypothetical protein